jgi:hypothetical protein
LFETGDGLVTSASRNRLHWLDLPSVRCGAYRCFFTALMIAVSLTSVANAQQPATPSQESVQQLALQQSQLAERYRKVEDLLLRLADVEATENPERAAILRRAAKQSREKFILDKLQSAAGKLSTEEYNKALDDQKLA